MNLIKKIKKLNYKRISYHILFWVVMTLFFDIISSYIHERKFSLTLLNDLLFYFPSDVIAVYFTIYFLIPKYLLKKNYLKFTAFFLLFLVGLTFFITLPLQYVGVSENFRNNLIKPGKEIPTFSIFVKFSFLWVITLKLALIGIASAIKLSKIWFKSQKRQQALEKEKLEIALQLRESELKYLKSQINPHFLFNALNNLYSLTLEKSDKAPDVVLKISALLDFVLYECNVPYIELEKEIENVRNYIDLQKIRFGAKAVININISKNIKNIKIAPLIILPFVENSFKHGLSNNFGRGEININLRIENNKLFFDINNTVANSESNNNGHSGIGLKNVKKRLELQYKDLYKCDIIKDDNLFSVFLEIEL